VTQGIKTALIGFGKIAAGYADDPAQSRWYPYATHAQVLRDHPEFEWQGVVDVAAEARKSARERWQVETAECSRDLTCANEIELAVIATPPENRTEILSAFPKLRAVLVEKPLALTLHEAESFLDACKKRGILVAVNLPRRSDKSLRALAQGGLEQRIGRPMAIFGTYGNGLQNNGSHLVDLVRMLFGEVVEVQSVAHLTPILEGPIPGDTNPAFSLRLDNKHAVMVHPIRFSHYREVGLDIWGERGRLSLLHESLTLIQSPVAPSRALTGANEIVYEAAETSVTSVGYALYEIYENLAATLSGEAKLDCSGETGLGTMRVIDSILRSYAAEGCPIQIVGRA